VATIYGPDGFAYSNGLLASVASANWEKLSGFADLNVDTNQLKPSLLGQDGSVRLTSGAWGAGSTVEQWAQVTWATYVDFTGPTVFSDGASNYYYFEGASGSLDLYRVGGSTFTHLAGPWAHPGGTSNASGDVAYLEARVNGSTVDLIGKVNGTTVGSFSDTSASRLTSGRPGIRMWHSTSSARMDDFSAGDFSAGGVARMLALLGVG
jgi:hypothetical protein